MDLLSHIVELEKLTDKQRRDWILRYLNARNIPVYIHEYQTGTNLIVEAVKRPFIGIGSHFDTVPNSPGANDNGSAIAVCLEIAERLKDSPLNKLGVEIYFFDEEEKGLLGSQAFIKEADLGGMLGLINMELVGQGSRMALWPLTQKSRGRLLSCFEDQAQKLSVQTDRFDRLIMHSADHESFRKAGIDDSFTFSCISDQDLEAAFHYYKALEFNVDKKTLEEILRKAPIFDHYHQATDKSIHLNESSLQMAADCIWRTLLELDRAFS